MRRVRLTITDSWCRCFCSERQFLVEDLCPPLCHKLWNSIYPQACALLNGAGLGYGGVRAKRFDAKCPNGGRASIHGEIMEEE